MTWSKNDDYEFFRRSGAVILAAIDTCDDRDQLAELRELKAQTTERLLQASFKPPVLFGFRAPGYVTVGVLGMERTLPHPGLSGLDYAWIILLHGIHASSVLHASTVLRNPGKRPGNALRNCLAEAADWVERAGGCVDLANAMRSPAMVITGSGGICFTPPKGLTLNLHPK